MRAQVQWQCRVGSSSSSTGAVSQPITVQVSSKGCRGSWAVAHSHCTLCISVSQWHLTSLSSALKGVFSPTVYGEIYPGAAGNGAEGKAVPQASTDEWTQSSGRSSKSVTSSLSHHLVSAKLLSQAQQHSKVMALLSCHCPFMGNKPQAFGVFSPCEQKLGFYSLGKCLHPAPEGRKPSGLWYNSFSLISAALIRQSSSGSSLPLSSSILSR